MKLQRRQFVQSLALVPLVPTLALKSKPSWYVDPSDPVFDTPVLSKGQRWSSIYDLTHARPRGLDGAPVDSGPPIPLRDLDLQDPRLSLSAVTRELSVSLREFAMTLSGAPGATHARKFDETPYTHTALAIASMHWDSGDEVVDYVGYVNSLNLRSMAEPYWAEVCLGDILDLREALLTAGSDEEVSRVREEVLELLVFRHKRTYDLTREGEAGGNQAKALVDLLEVQGHTELALAVSDIRRHAEWQVEHQSEEGSRARFVYLTEDLSIIIPWDGGHLNQLLPEFTLTVWDLQVYAKYLATYREAVESGTVLVNRLYEVDYAAELTQEDFETLEDILLEARKDPGFQIFVNYDLRSTCPKLQERIHVRLHATADDLNDAMQQWLDGEDMQPANA